METELEQVLEGREDSAGGAEGGIPEDALQEEARNEAQELRAALLEANIRVALLIEGAAREQLSEAGILSSRRRAEQDSLVM